MNKVQEKFWLAVIHIAKYIVLGLSFIGIIYFAIWLTYQKIILEPKINEYNYKITLLEEKKEPIDVSLQAILPKIETINGKVASLEPEIISQQNKVNRLNDNVKENCRILGTISSPISLPTDSSECIIARKRLKEVMKPLPMMEEDYDSLLNSRKDLLDNKDALEQKIKDIEDDIAEIKQDIRDFKNENKNPIIGTFLFIFGAI